MTMKGEVNVTWKRTQKRWDAFAVGERKSGALTVRNARNVVCKNGEIHGGVGIALARDPQGETMPIDRTLPGADSVFYVWDRTQGGAGKKTLAFLTPQGAFYVYDETTGAFALQRSFSSRMKAVTAVKRLEGAEEYYTLLIGNSGVYVYTTETGLTAISGESALPAACFCGGRVFYARDGHTLVYSAPFTPDDFQSSIDGGGRLALPSEYGILTAVVALFGKVYLFYERGIGVLSVGGSAREFRVESVGYGGGRIFGDSVGCVCVGGERVFFLAEDGVYAMDDNRVWRVAKNILVKPVRGNHVCNHAEFDGLYAVRFLNEEGEDCALAVDAETGEGFSIFSPKGLASYGGEAFCVSGGYLQKIRLGGDLPDGEAFAVKTEYTDLGAAGVKTLERIELFGEGTCTLTVAAGDKAKSFAVAFENGRAVCKVLMRGKEFAFGFVLEKGCVLRGVCAAAQGLQSRLQGGGRI